MKVTRSNTTLARQAGTSAVSLALGALFIGGSMGAAAGSSGAGRRAQRASGRLARMSHLARSGGAFLQGDGSDHGGSDRNGHVATLARATGVPARRAL